MSTRFTLTGIILLASMVSIIADSAIAQTVPLGNNTPRNVKQFCRQNGGTFFAGAKGWGYGCMLDDGSGIVCGGLPQNKRPLAKGLG